MEANAQFLLWPLMQMQFWMTAADLVQDAAFVKDYSKSKAMCKQRKIIIKPLKLGFSVYFYLSFQGGRLPNILFSWSNLQ